MVQSDRRRSRVPLGRLFKSIQFAYISIFIYMYIYFIEKLDGLPRLIVQILK